MPLTRRAALAAGLATGMLGTASRAVPAARAQDATPVAETVAPPQALLPPQPEGQQGQTAAINGIDIYYEVYGEGKPVLLLHGGLGNGDHWVNQIQPLVDAGYQPIVMDSRGHGRSSFDEQQITYALMASDVVGLLDHLGVEKADLVGWSDGGIIGIELAIARPERMNRIVAYGANVDPTGVRLDVGTNAYFNAYIEANAADYPNLSPAPERWDEFLANISTMWATEPNYTDAQLETITTPILILDGANEEAIDLNQTKWMALVIPSAELLIMPDTGHFAMMEQPEEFNRIVLEFLGGE